ncbi:MAG: MBOAT family O-acyltransferase [Eubacteriales bacterium]|nr:MBOAT family O-acyltransferase [Eubacteriales bacterium]
MVFSSPVFLFAYLPLTLAVYYLMPLRWRNLALFLLSLVFYGWDKPIYIPVMLFSVTVSYLCGFPIGKYRDRDRHRARVWLVVSLVLNLSVLVFFKYTNFIIENLRLIPPLAGVLHPLEWLELPIGISFYTFQIMSYSIDLYRGENETQRSYIAFGTYVALFPQLIAGPIVRYRDVDRQLLSRTHTVDRFASGVRRFAVGFGKKILLGDALAAVYAYLSTAADFEFTVLSGWLMVATYTLHIYFDFSGYSDMAIGLGRMFGFEFPENFRYPYMASSITDFWRRWHITLSTWFREYVYIPLGGNRRGRARQYFNLAGVWLLTGLWHGASWNFVLWGLFYLILLVAEKAFLLRLLERNRLTRVLGHIGALLLVGIGWMIFDHTDLGEAFRIIGGLFGIGTAGFAAATVSWQALRLLPLLAVSVAVATPYPTRLWNRLTGRRPALTVLEPVLLVAVLALSVACAVRSDYSPFLYFNF